MISPYTFWYVCIKKKKKAINTLIILVGILPIHRFIQCILLS